MDLTGHVGIVTGGGTHLGLAMAATLCELGATVVLASRRGALCEHEASRLRTEHGFSVHGASCDVTNEVAVERLVADTVVTHGRLDIMICNAGGSASTTYPPNASIDEFTATFDMNVKSTFICSQSAARAMIAGGRGGKILTLGSIHGVLAADTRLYEGLKGFNRSGPNYQAAKGAIVNLTKGLAVEFAQQGITVNCISPGQIPKLESTDPRMIERSRMMNPLQTTGMPEDLKGAVALLASDAGKWITGQNLLVDGGWSIW